jgi:hypothetical protein
VGRLGGITLYLDRHKAQEPLGSSPAPGRSHPTLTVSGNPHT